MTRLRPELIGYQGSGFASARPFALARPSARAAESTSARTCAEPKRATKPTSKLLRKPATVHDRDDRWAERTASNSALDSIRSVTGPCAGNVHASLKLFTACRIG